MLLIDGLDDREVCLDGQEAFCDAGFEFVTILITSSMASEEASVSIEGIPKLTDDSDGFGSPSASRRRRFSFGMKTGRGGCRIISR